MNSQSFKKLRIGRRVETSKSDKRNAISTFHWQACAFLSCGQRPCSFQKKRPAPSTPRTVEREATLHHCPKPTTESVQQHRNAAQAQARQLRLALRPSFQYNDGNKMFRQPHKILWPLLRVLRHLSYVSGSNRFDNCVQCRRVWCSHRSTCGRIEQAITMLIAE